MSYDYKKKKKSYSKNGGSRKFDPRKDVKDIDVQGKGFRTGNSVFHISDENDPSWWCKEPTLVRDAANLPYSWATGPDYVSSLGMTVPAVMKLEAQICPGISNDSTSPVNIAARRHYAYIRSANSGAKNYGPQDLIQYFMAMDSIYAYISYLMRIYGTVNLYSPENRFVPKWLLTSMNLDYEDIVSHIPDLRAYINTLIYKAASFAVPSEMGLFERHIQLFGNYYSDYNNTRAQIYYYDPTDLFQWDEVNGKLDPVTVGGVATKTFAQLKTIGDTLINPVAASETASIMSGDIIKACGDAIIKLSTMNEDFMCIPVYSTEVLTQIHNSTIVGVPYANSNVITQNAAADTLLYNPVFSLNTYAPTTQLAVIGQSRVIDIPFDTISPELNMVATRDANCMIVNPNDATQYMLKSAGTEFLCGLVIYCFDKNLNSVTTTGTVYTIAPYFAGTYSGLLNLVTLAGNMSRFDWAPMICPITKNGNVESRLESFFDVTKFTVVQPDNIDRLHEVALLSAFVSPAVAARSALK